MKTMHNLEIIIGTYEEFLLGYRLELNDDNYFLKQSFADKSHNGYLKCVAVQGQWVASGGTDNRIIIYDMKTRKQTYILQMHDSTVNALAFTPDETHLISGGDDGQMVCTRIKTWCSDATWKKAHSGGAITHISCHPSGKLALSLGSDLVLRTWNLVKGRVAYKTNLKTKNTLGPAPDCLTWSQDGDYFTLCGHRVVEIWSIKTANVAISYKIQSKPVCLCWISNTELVVGSEDGKLNLLHIDENQKTETIEAHKTRVKAISCYSDTVVTASSSGEIKLWNLDKSTQKLTEIAAVDIGCRPTCIGILESEIAVSSNTQTALQDQVDEKSSTSTKRKTQPKQTVTIEYDDDNVDTSFLMDQTDDSDEKSNVKMRKENDGKSSKRKKIEIGPCK